MRIGVDTGGTFTDVVAVDADGTLRVLKLSSTPADPARAVLLGIAAVIAPAAPHHVPEGVPHDGNRSAPHDLAATPDVHEIIHGTTVATNALLERRGGPTALVATAGFEDVLILRRQARPALYALHPVVAPPLVPDELCFGLVERLGPDGSVLVALSGDALDALAVALGQRVARGEIRSVAVALLHSYASDEHERRVAAPLRELGVPVSLSSEVLPEHREYERTSTTVVDAYVAPVIAGYLGRLSAALCAPKSPVSPVSPGSPARLRVMQSSGGAASAALAERRPVHTLLSGPAAGVVGARAVARRAGHEKIITFDMGGTSTDVALVDGEPTLESENEVAGHPVRVPSLWVHTIGAGGGSIAFRDEGGALKVGPRSAGAWPGPACYGRGGASTTVTDAALVLGRLDPARFLGGSMRLDEEAALAAITALAASLGLDARTTAEGIARIATVVMARAIRVISVERGHDPRDYTLCAFGGAGGMHACDVAAELGMSRILVPAAPGLLCAYGALVADVTRDLTRTRLAAAGPRLAASDLASEFEPLDAAAHAALDEEGIPRARRRLERRADLRYAGQSYELSIDLPRALPDDDAHHDHAHDAAANEINPTFDLLAAFHALHHRRYGFSDAQRPVERVALRVHARGLSPAPPPLRVERAHGEPLVGERDGTPIYQRERLAPGTVLKGPAILVEYSGTTWLAPGWRATVDEDGALLLLSAAAIS